MSGPRPPGKLLVGYAAQSFNIPEIPNIMSGWMSGTLNLSFRYGIEIYVFTMQFNEKDIFTHKFVLVCIMLWTAISYVQLVLVLDDV